MTITVCNVAYLQKIKLKRQNQFDELTARGYKFDMLQDEYTSPSGVIVPAWPPSPTRKKRRKEK